MFDVPNYWVTESVDLALLVIPGEQMSAERRTKDKYRKLRT
jgi:hypothetical protein